MDGSVPPFNFTPLQNSKTKKHIGFGTKLLVPFIFLLVIMVGLVSYTLLQQRPQVTKAPAAGTDSISCNANEHGWLVYYTFSGPNAQTDCQNCTNSPDQCLLPHVGQLNKCYDGSGTQCREFGSCSGGGCNLSTALPACSVAQLDCVNQPFPTPGSINAGKQTSNCSCPQPPTSTPTPTPPITLTTTPTPTPTPSITITATTTPTPTLTSAPTPTPTPLIGTLTCGIKGCKNDTNPCAPGLVCINGPTDNICSLPQLTTRCQQNGSYDSCCNAGGGGTLTCGQKGCRDSNNPCQSGLTCVQSTNENYCALSALQTSCISNPSFSNCCALPTTITPTQPVSTQAVAQVLKPTLIQTGESRKWYLVPAALILIGLIF